MRDVIALSSVRRSHRIGEVPVHDIIKYPFNMVMGDEQTMIRSLHHAYRRVDG